MSKNEGKGWRNWGDHPVVVFIGVLAGFVAIIGFITGYDNIQEIINLIRNTGKSPASTPSVVPEEFTDILYDDFNDPSFNGIFDRDLWMSRLSNTCKVTQTDGVLVFTNTLSQIEAADCILFTNRSRLLSIDKLGAFEADVKIASDHSGAYINQGVQFATDETSAGYWATYCGLNATSGHPRAEFEIWSTKSGVEIHKEIEASYDSWYTARLEINPDTMEIKCFADNLLVGSIVPKNASELKTVRFERYLNMFRDKGAFATSYTDNIKIIP